MRSRSTSEKVPANAIVEPLGCGAGGDAGVEMTAVGAWFVLPVTVNSQTPRPCVAARRIEPSFVALTSYTDTAGRPVPNLNQLAPLSVERYTPTSVPQ